MGEHTFDAELTARWREVADHARYEFDQWNSVSSRASPAANVALLALKRVLAETVSKSVAEWAVTNWLITREPIEACVQVELADQRPWPSEASKRRGQLTPPSH
jgi:hypothetical protein